MNPASLKNRIHERLWEAVRADDGILSATLAGSFLDEPSLEGISDIDLVVVVERLDAARFERLTSAFDAALRGELAEWGYNLLINPTLGPLKFNEPSTAVLHLMLYSREAHVEHAVVSPFTCFDWQRSTVHCKRSLADVFPVFNLQPHHFMSSRRGVGDYLHDFHAGVVSYRELACAADGYREVARIKPMTVRDRHEFAYHILRFLMQNLVKLVRRANLTLRGEGLLAEYFLIFPERESEIRRFFVQLRAKKQARDFAEPLAELEHELNAFVDSFETQFRRAFFDSATRHVAFRHGPTTLNRQAVGERIFVGRMDPPLETIEPSAWQPLVAELSQCRPGAVFSSPLVRCRQSLEVLASHHSLPAAVCDERLREIDYGELEGLSVDRSQQVYPVLFEAWDRGEDPRFPGGESSREVAVRAMGFVRDRWRSSGSNTLTCTHNVVLRSLIGQLLGLPPRDWHRLEVPHLAPLTFVATRDHGLFVDIPTETARTMFGDFASMPKVA